MISHAIIAFSIVAFTSSTAQELTLPVTTCKRNSSDYLSCLKLATEEAWPRIVEGLPEFNFQPLDPLFFKYQRNKIDRGGLHGEIIVRDVVVKGLKNMRFLDVRSQFVDNIFHLEYDVLMPWVYINATCEASGNIGGMKMGGKGRFNLTMGDIKSIWDMTGHVTNDIWTIEHFGVVPQIGKFKIRFRDLFDGNEELNDLATGLVNEYWPALYRIVLPIAPKDWDKWFSGIANILFSKVSFSKTFP